MAPILWGGALTYSNQHSAWIVRTLTGRTYLVFDINQIFWRSCYNSYMELSSYGRAEQTRLLLFRCAIHALECLSGFLFSKYKGLECSQILRHEKKYHHKIRYNVGNRDQKTCCAYATEKKRLVQSSLVVECDGPLLSCKGICGPACSVWSVWGSSNSLSLYLLSSATLFSAGGSTIRLFPISPWTLWVSFEHFCFKQFLVVKVSTHLRIALGVRGVFQIRSEKLLQTVVEDCVWTPKLHIGLFMNGIAVSIHIFISTYDKDMGSHYAEQGLW